MLTFPKYKKIYLGTAAIFSWLGESYIDTIQIFWDRKKAEEIGEKLTEFAFAHFLFLGKTKRILQSLPKIIKSER